MGYGGLRMIRFRFGYILFRWQKLFSQAESAEKCIINKLLNLPSKQNLANK